MTYRNKTYVAFASEDIASYRMMEAWRANQHIEFDFFNAHTLYVTARYQQAGDDQAEPAGTNEERQAGRATR